MLAFHLRACFNLLLVNIISVSPDVYGPLTIKTFHFFVLVITFHFYMSDPSAQIETFINSFRRVEHLLGIKQLFSALILHLSVPFWLLPIDRGSSIIQNSMHGHIRQCLFILSANVPKFNI